MPPCSLLLNVGIVKAMRNPQHWSHFFRGFEASFGWGMLTHGALLGANDGHILAIWRPIGVHTTQFMFEHLWEIRSFFSVVLNSGTRLMGIRVHQSFYGLMGYS